MNFFRTPFFLPWLYPTLQWRIPTESKEIFLTFDDGPVPGPTEFVLRELEKINAKATFFCIGENVQKHSGLLKEIVARGHQVGNHTFNHLKGWSTGTDMYVDNIRQCQNQFIESSGNKEDIALPLLFRPPYGRITRKQINHLPDYRIIMWDVLTHDYAKGISPEQCLSGSLRATRPGSIVVFHDSYKAEKNLTFVLPRYLEACAKRNFAFKAITSI